MLKPLHIICLFTLLILGFAACKKEKEADSVFTIKQLSEYDPSNNYINYKIYGPYDGVFDLNGDNIDDIRIHRGGSNVFLTLINSFNIEYSTLNNDTIRPYKLGDKVDSFHGIQNDNYVLYHYGSNGNLDYSWNSDNTDNYIVFRKNENGNFKYGWIRISKNQYGPSIMQTH